MRLIEIALSMLFLGHSGSVSAFVLNRNGFLGTQQSLKYVWNRKSSRFSASCITMMPEGPEVRTIVDQLQGAVGKRLVDIRFLSGRYVRNGKPDNFHAFAKTMTPVFQPHSNIPDATDIIKEWKNKGKFMYIILDSGMMSRQQNHDTEDFQRSIWITLGMTGQFVNEEVHQKDLRFARWFLAIMDHSTLETRKIYYHDQRNFGTLKFCLSKDQLTKKLESLGPDILDPETNEQQFLQIMSQQRPELNVCKFLMDQAVRLDF